MSIEKVKLAIKMMESTGEEILFTGGVSDKDITDAESRLGLEFPLDYKYFLGIYGSLSFEGESFYGLTQFGLDVGEIPCVIFATESALKRTDISNNMIYIKASGYGPLFSLHLSDSKKHSPVVETSLSYKRHKEIKILANSFGDFFYDEIKAAIEDL